MGRNGTVRLIIIRKDMAMGWAFGGDDERCSFRRKQSGGLGKIKMLGEVCFCKYHAVKLSDTE